MVAVMNKGMDAAGISKSVHRGALVQEQSAHLGKHS